MRISEEYELQQAICMSKIEHELSVMKECASRRREAKSVLAQDSVTGGGGSAVTPRVSHWTGTRKRRGDDDEMVEYTAARRKRMSPPREDSLSWARTKEVIQLSDEDETSGGTSVRLSLIHI